MKSESIRCAFDSHSHWNVNGNIFDRINWIISLPSHGGIRMFSLKLIDHIGACALILIIIYYNMFVVLRLITTTTTTITYIPATSATHNQTVWNALCFLIGSYSLTTKCNLILILVFAILKIAIAQAQAPGTWLISWSMY